MDVANHVPAAIRRTAVHKYVQLELVLEQIANFRPVISRNSIVKNSTSLGDVWQKIRHHSGLQSTRAPFLVLVNIRPETDECAEVV